jgi:hypothetical protein
MRIINNYMNELQESELITEDIYSFVRKMTQGKLDKIMFGIKKGIVRGDAKTIEKAIALVPIISSEKFKKIARKASSKGFDQSYMMSMNQLETKYPDVPDSALSYLSSMIALGASHSDKPDVKTREVLIKFGRVRKRLKTKLGEQSMSGEGAFAYGFGISAFILLATLFPPLAQVGLTAIALLGVVGLFAVILKMTT